MGQETIAVGEQQFFYPTSEKLIKNMESILDGSHSLMLIGWITYQNRGGNRRYTAFCRIYDSHQARFTGVDGEIPEYDRYDYNS